MQKKKADFHIRPSKKKRLQNPHYHLAGATITPRIIRNRRNVYLLRSRCREIEVIVPLGIVQDAARATDNRHTAQ